MDQRDLRGLPGVIRAALLAVAGAVLIVSCGSGPEVVEGDDVVVRMFDNRFEFDEIRIPTGGSVNWVGAGNQPHNAVDAENRWSTESVFGSLRQLDGDEAKMIYDEPGRYVFFCTFHGNSAGDGMAGVLIVGEG